MNRLQLHAAIRTTAAAMAVFMTIATLNSLIEAAEPQHSALLAQTAARQAARVAADAAPIVAVTTAMLESDH